MAEVIGIVSGAAGLTSLALQVASGTSRLRKAYKLTKRVPVEFDIVARDLDFICEVAKRLYCTDGQTNQADLIVVHCKSSIQAVVGALDALSQKATVTAAQKGLRTSVQRLQWVSSCQDDLESLKKLAHDAKVNLMLLGQLGMIQTLVSPPLQPSQLDSSSDGPSSNHHGTSTSLQTRSNWGRGRRGCLKRSCTCCCHRKGTVHRRFWAFKYTPLSMILGSCDNPTCDGRQYTYSFRVALSQLGFPWAVTAAIGIQSEATGYSIGLSLRPQHIVRYTSPGFEILYNVSERFITLDEGISRFTEMYRKDPSFIHHIDPSGKGYLEKLISDIYCDMDAFVSLLRLFIATFKMTQGLDNIKLNLEFLQKLILLDPDFGNTSSIQHDIIHSPEKALMTLRRNYENLDAASNFLGQTPLHLAIVRNDSELTRALLDAGRPLNVLDCCGNSPLVYTAVLGHSGCAKSFLSGGADLAYTLSSTDGPAFIRFALFHIQRDYIFEVLGHIQTLFPDDKWPSLCSSIAKHILSYIAFEGPSQFLHRFSCDDITALVTMIEDINFDLVGEFDRRDSEECQLLHFIWPLEYTKIFIEHGYTGINRKDSKGATPLMVAAYKGIPTLVQYYIGMNALANDQNHIGSTVLMKTLEGWVSSPDAIGLNGTRDYPGTIRGLPIVMEWLNLLKELGRDDDSRISLVKLIRRCRFEELELDHTCCLGQQEQGGLLHSIVQWVDTAEKHAQLDAEMKSIEGHGFEELKDKLFRRILKSYDKHLSNQGRLRWKEELDLFKREARPVKRPGPPAPGYTIDYRNDRFKSTFASDSPPKKVLRELVRYITDLVRQATGHSEDRHEDLEEVDDRRMLWVAELMEFMEIPMSLLQEESRIGWEDDPGPEQTIAANSQFVGISGKLLSKRST
ncbi:hypothetical protein PG997_001509 [Apiospora hydei]|uniref:Ankyrin repeat protein n=1 Tax=Apiospora hydei TaxID=1337664 RepID=A0ABR1XDS8_9PEZI